jgi:hypothetical protein
MSWKFWSRELDQLLWDAATIGVGFVLYSAWRRFRFWRIRRKFYGMLRGVAALCRQAIAE